MVETQLLGLADSGKQPQSKQAPETYKKIKVLGKGSFGKAFLVKCGSDGSHAVVKKIDIKKMSEEDKQSTFREAKILEVLNHPNIIRFKEVYKTKAGQLCIVMDYADGGDMALKIQEYQTRNKGKPEVAKDYLTEDQILYWFTQICLALKHCHDRKILHRDIKAQNIFLTKSGMIKLGDFGIARVLQSTTEMAATVVGTPYYLSPEIVQSNTYDYKTDIWSIGVLLYEMCALRPPFNGQNLHQLAIQIVSGIYQPIDTGRYSPELSKLISSLLCVDSTARPSINELLKYPLLRKRIRQIMSDELFYEEFSHTVLHQQQIFRKTASQQFTPGNDDQQPQDDGNDPNQENEGQQDEQIPEISSEMTVGVGSKGANNKAGSYGYTPFQIPKRSREIEQDIDPVGVANDVLDKISKIEANREARASGAGGAGGEVVFVGDSNVPANKRRHGAFDHKESASSQQQQMHPAIQQIRKENQDYRKEYSAIKRQQMEELQRKRSEILKANIEKSKLDDQRTLERKRKIKAEKEQRKQQDERILKKQKDDKAKQRAEFLAKIKKNKDSCAKDTTNVVEAQGGVKFELVGLPQCMDEPSKEPVAAQTQHRGGELLVFDMSSGAGAGEQPKPNPNRSRRQQWKKTDEQPRKENQEFSEVLVSEKDRKRLEERQSEQTRAEFDHYRHMMDKVLGADEELKNSQERRRGGELVLPEEQDEPEENKRNTTHAQADGNIAQALSEDEPYEDYDEEYEEDFHEILEEVVRNQADLEEDRDDDPAFDETEVFKAGIQSAIREEQEEVKSGERKTTPATAASEEPLEEPTDYFPSMRDRSTEEQIWEQVIDRTGREKFNTVYKIVLQFGQERFFPEQQAQIKSQVATALDGQMSEVDQVALIGLVSSRMIIEDFSKKQI